ncbi:MAG: ribonuclease D [Nitrospiraceae bacterium]
MRPGGEYIDSQAALDAYCDRLESVTRLALDTEFIGEDTFVPRLELLQLSTGTHHAVIDVPTLVKSGDLARLWSIIQRESVLKVVHAGRQDLEIIASLTGQIPRPFFDTQIAAAMIGQGAQIAYAQLVQRVHSLRLSKSHTFTNWSQRPLTGEQIDYAMEDVEYLLPIYDWLLERLRTLGRIEWATEEFRRLESAVIEKDRGTQERYQKIRGWENLKPRQAAVLRALSAWRESEARRRNVPRGRIMRDEVLLQLARQSPTKPEDLRGLRGLHPGEVDRHGAALTAIVRTALALPKSEWPEPPPERRAEPESAGHVELLQAVLKARAVESEIAPTLLATTAELQKIIDERDSPTPPSVPVLDGWRRTLVGDLLLDVAAGRARICIDTTTGKLAVQR